VHELTIARSLIELASEHAERKHADRVTRINIRLGVASGLLRPLYFCFATASRGTRCDGAILEIEEVPLTVMCPTCNEVKTPGTRYSFRCPDCGSPTPEVVTGREMQLVTIEVEKKSVHSPVTHEPACSNNKSVVSASLSAAE